MSLLKKDKIIFVTVTSMMLMLVGCFHYMSTLYTNVINPPRFMSWETVKYNFFQIKTPDLTSNFYYMDFQALLRDFPTISIYHSFDDNQNGCAVFFDDFKKMDIKLVRGRVFTHEDIENNSNVVLVSEAMLKECKLINKKHFFYFDGKYYEVIGIYEEQEYLPFYYVNLFANNLSDNLLNGMIYLDGEREIITRFMRDIGENPVNLNSGMNLSLETDYNERDFIYFLVYLLKSWLFTLLAISPTLLLILNVNTIIKYMVILRYNEFYSRLLSGCSFNGVRKQVVLEILYISLFDYVLILVFESLFHSVNLVCFTAFILFFFFFFFGNAIKHTNFLLIMKGK